jgi:hypothetical protein
MILSFAIITKMEGKDKWEDQTAYPYVAQTTEGTSYLIIDGANQLDENDVGTPCLVTYAPGDQFCSLIPIEMVGEAFAALDHYKSTPFSGSTHH